MLQAMNRWSFATRLLLALALFGLVLGPVAAPSGAPVAAQAMVSMPDGMPCCPDERPAVPDCAKDCPLALLCMAGTGGVQAPATPDFLSGAPADDVFLRGRDVVLSSLAGEPPPRPPKA
jgi:hypothetical protein